jgi:hypothetical protein
MMRFLSIYKSCESKIVVIERNEELGKEEERLYDDIRERV